MTAPVGSTSSSKIKITEAVILMAGSGSRLNGPDGKSLKPLIPISGRPLISYALESLAAAGIRTVHAVVGFEAERLKSAMQPLAPDGMQLCFIENPQWQKQNGISLLAASSHVNAPFVLTMGDHIFESRMIELLISQAEPDCLNLAVDLKLKAIFDLQDAMKVILRADRVIEIGKDIQHYNAIDTGLFVCPAEIFSYLEQAQRKGDVSLADGVRAMAQEGKVRGVDIGNGHWFDIDTLEMLRHAQQNLA